MPGLASGAQRYRDDHGAADPAVAAVLAAYAAGADSEVAVLTALTAARLLVPVVAMHAGEPSASGGERASDIALPVIIGTDGRRAIPAFTGIDALQRWQSSARPVPVPARAVWQSAVADSSAVIIDIAGPVPLSVDGARLAALAAGCPAPGMHEDPDVWQLVAAAAAGVAPGIRVRLAPPTTDLDFALELAPPPGSTGRVPDETAGLIAQAVTTRLGNRARRGIAVVLRHGG